MRELLGIPGEYAVAAVLPFGKPVKQLTKLERVEVDEFIHLERWEGGPLRDRV